MVGRAPSAGAVREVTTAEPLRTETAVWVVQPLAPRSPLGGCVCLWLCRGVCRARWKMAGRWPLDTHDSSLARAAAAPRRVLRLVVPSRWCGELRPSPGPQAQCLLLVLGTSLARPLSVLKGNGSALPSGLPSFFFFFFLVIIK